MTKVIIKKDADFKYIFNSVYPLTPEIVEAMVIIVKDNMDNFSFSEYKCPEDKEASVKDTFTPVLPNAILVKGCDRNSALNIEAIFYLNTYQLVIKSNDSSSSMSLEEKKEYFASYCGSLEIMAHKYITIGECYTKLFKATRAYINSNYDKRYEEFNNDGYSLNLKILLSPPPKE